MAPHEITPVPLNWRLLRRLRAALPFRARDYVAPQTAQALEVLAVRAHSQPEFMFLQITATLATLSSKIVASNGPNFPTTHPGTFVNFAAPPKAGKTNAHIFGEALRRRLYTATGINNEILAGTTVGIYNGTVRCARRGGLPLLAPDEGISTVNGLLEPPSSSQTNFKPEVFLSSAWSGANVARAKGSAEQLATENARLSILAFGTLADISVFHQLCRKFYPDRGLLGRFMTGYAPTYAKRCALPIAQNQEEESLVALNKAELASLLGDALLNLYRQAEGPGFQGFYFSDEALNMLETKRIAEAAGQDEDEDEADWSELLKRRLLSHLEQEFRSTELTEKWALVLHLVDLSFHSINFIERTVNAQPLPLVIEVDTVRRADALVRRMQDQDAFFLQVLHISTATRSRDIVYVAENVDFVLYKCLRQLLMIWPGPIVTSESFTDRTSKLGLQIPYEEVIAAGQALAAMGSLTRETRESRISSPGIFKSGRVPRQSFRFYKTHPDLINLETLEELGVDLKDYTSRYHMDYYQVVDAQALRTQRSEKKFNEWVTELPESLLPCDEAVPSDEAIGASTSTGPHSVLPVCRKNSQFQHENVDLRFGAALGKGPTAKRARQTPPDPQHLYRLPGGPAFTNHTS